MIEDRESGRKACHRAKRCVEGKGAIMCLGRPDHAEKSEHNEQRREQCLTDRH